MPDQPDAIDALSTEVSAVLEEIYASYLRGDAHAIDAHLADTVTIFDSAAPDLVEGLSGLAALRAARVGASAPHDGITETSLTIGALSVRQVAGLAVAAWWLRVEGEDAAGRPLAPELVRNSAVFARTDGRLRIIHLHEDVWQAAGGPPADRQPRQNWADPA
jgi:hypothetical protein